VEGAVCIFVGAAMVSGGTNIYSKLKLGRLDGYPQLYLVRALRGLCVHGESSLVRRTI